MMEKIFLAVILSSSVSWAGTFNLESPKPLDLNPTPTKYRYQKEYKYDVSTRVLIRGRINHKTHKIEMEYAAKNEIDKTLKMKEWNEADTLSFMETHEMALTGISAGGLLYLFPQKNIFFWDTDAETAKNMSRGRKVWTNPIVGNILSGALSRFQKTLRDDTKGEVIESSGVRSFMMVLVDPAYSFADKINRMYNRKIFHDGSTELISMTPSELEALGRDRYNAASVNYVGLRFTLRF